jgi:geranylgeranyl pyrophosphate synthase
MAEADAAARDAGAPAPGGGPLPELRERVDGALERVLDRQLEGLPAAVADPVRDAVLSPGKRIRPLLLLGAFEASAGDRRAGGIPDAAVELSCSVELVHAYSLVHDDLPCMDDDVLRRGRPTLHVQHGPEAAVFTGAVLMPMAARTLWEGGAALELPGARRREALRILTVASGAEGMVGGQLLDLRAEGRAVDRQELERIHRGKTAALMAAAVRMGAVAGGAGEERVERLGRFGVRLGLAFQAVDDILDVTGHARELGKTGGRDEALGKATYPSVMGLEEAEAVSRRLAEEARGELEGLDGSDALSTITSFVVERRR